MKKDGEEFFVAISGGLSKCGRNTVTILAETAEMPGEIDIERAESAKRRAEERLADHKQEHVDFKRAEIALQKAITRLRVGKS